MIRFLNIIYYFIWRFWLVNGKRLDKFIFFVLQPVKWLIFSIPFVRKKHIKDFGSLEEAEKYMNKAYNHVMNNEAWGFNMMFAWCIYGGVIAFYIWGLYFVLAHYFPALLDSFDQNKIPCALAFVGLAALIIYPASYWKDKFKKYFRELDKVKGIKRFAYKTMTFVFVFGSFLFWLWTIGFAHHKPIF